MLRLVLAGLSERPVRPAGAIGGAIQDGETDGDGRRTRRSARLLACAVAVLAAGAACRVDAPGADAEPTPTAAPVAARTLAVALPDDAGDGEHRGAAAFEALVEGLSGGALAVDVAPRGASCGTAQQCLDALREGAIDVTPAAVEDVARLLPEARILDVPYLFEEDAVVDRVFQGPFHARLRDALVDRAGLRAMAVGTRGGWRTLATTGRAVRTPDDVRGLTLWTADSPIEAELAAALGAAAATGPGPDVAGALDRGAVDGVTLPLPEIVARGLHARIRHVTLDRHAYAAVLWLVNDAAHQALPPAMRRTVEAGFNEVTRLSLAVPAERHADAVRAVEAAGGAVHALSADERKAFLMAAGRVATGYVERYGHEWLVWLEGAIAEAERDIAVARSGAAARGR